MLAAREVRNGRGEGCWVGWMLTVKITRVSCIQRVLGPQADGCCGGETVASVALAKDGPHHG